VWSLPEVHGVFWRCVGYLGLSTANSRSWSLTHSIPRNPGKRSAEDSAKQGCAAGPPSSVGFNVTPDVFRIEIESDKLLDYFDFSVWSFERFKKDFLENMEFITGKYFFGGSLFLNYSSQLDLVSDPGNYEVERLTHWVGVELTPVRYLYFNFDYEIGAPNRERPIDQPAYGIKTELRLKVPLTKVKNLFVKDKRNKK